MKVPKNQHKIQNMTINKTNLSFLMNDHCNFPKHTDIKSVSKPNMLAHAQYPALGKQSWESFAFRNWLQK